ncbi:unnamed protein product [Calicophoron daubneyi]|uniref:SAM domain-containing protein n=1 Tax=Calicophoron daubneyi TaxID=300641 RepID=A0AAV2TTS1_CALDB
MDSDESYETTSEVFREGETELSSSSSQESVNRNSNEIPELYASTFSGPGAATNANATTADNQIYSLTVKLKEQSLQIQALKEERIGFLEQITSLCSSLEKKESELVEFMQSYEQKANDVAQYMQEVQGLLSQLTTLFPDQLVDSGAAPSDNTEVLAESSLKPTTVAPLTAAPTNGSCTPEVSTNATGQPHVVWDQRGRALLHALSASVATASARNKQTTLPRNSDPSNATHLSNGDVPPRPTSKTIEAGGHQSSLSVHPTTSAPLPHAGTDKTSVTDDLEVTVCHLPPFCWSPEHVLHWLTEYACLPGGCLEAAKRLRIDGKQLTSLTGNKADKLLCLSDAGLRRKFQLALEDLRVHGSPGISRFPGPSHVRPRWVCEVWLRHHLGLSQLIPLFAVRRVDGRLLASLTICKSSSRPQLGNGNGRGQLISSPSEVMVQGNTGIPLPGNPIPIVDNSNKNNNSNSIKSDSKVGGVRMVWRGVSRKEMHRIILGLGRDNSTSSASSGGISGADLQPESKFFLGKREASSLRTGIELLRSFNFNLELLERARFECESTNDNLLVWTNDRVAKWLRDLGLEQFTKGIEGTGLHGAYMVLDPSFDVIRLMKHLHLPASIAVAHKLEENLYSLLKPARLREGVTPKQHSLFRRRSVSRPNRASIMQRSITSTNTFEYSAPTTPITTSPMTDYNSPTTPLFKITDHPVRNGVTIPQPTVLSPLSPSRQDKMNNSAPKITKSTNGFHLASVDSPSKQSFIGTPKREKRKAVTSGGDSGGGTSRLTRVFCRNKQPVQSPDVRRKAAETLPSTPSHAGPESTEDRSSTLVRKSSVKQGNQINNSPVKGKGLLHTASPFHNQQKKSNVVRGGVKPSEAPVVDPFDQDVGRFRMRIMLGQTPRLASLTGSAACTPHVNSHRVPTESKNPSISTSDKMSGCGWQSTQDVGAVNSKLPTPVTAPPASLMRPFSNPGSNSGTSVALSSLSLSSNGDAQMTHPTDRSDTTSEL